MTIDEARTRLARLEAENKNLRAQIADHERLITAHRAEREKARELLRKIWPYLNGNEKAQTLANQIIAALQPCNEREEES